MMLHLCQPKRWLKLEKKSLNIEKPSLFIFQARGDIMKNDYEIVARVELKRGTREVLRKKLV